MACEQCACDSVAGVPGNLSLDFRRQCYGFTTALERDCYMANAIRAAMTGTFVKRSTPLGRPLSGTSLEVL
jgi:hypothetical protein